MQVTFPCQGADKFDGVGMQNPYFFYLLPLHKEASKHENTE